MARISTNPVAAVKTANVCQAEGRFANEKYCEHQTLTQTIAMVSRTTASIWRSSATRS